MPESKKVVIKVAIHDDKEKKKVLKAVSSLSGIESIAMDMKDKKLTVIGDVDPVDVIGKLKKKYSTEIVTVGPAKEEKKKEEKKDEGKKDGEKKKDEKEILEDYLKANKAAYGYPPYMVPQYYVYSVEENPNGCVIC